MLGWWEREWGDRWNKLTWEHCVRGKERVTSLATKSKHRNWVTWTQRNMRDMPEHVGGVASWRDASSHQEQERNVATSQEETVGHVIENQKTNGYGNRRMSWQPAGGGCGLSYFCLRWYCICLCGLKPNKRYLFVSLQCLECNLRTYQYSVVDSRKTVWAVDTRTYAPGAMSGFEQNHGKWW